MDNKNSFWAIFCGGDILLKKAIDGSYTLPCETTSPVEIQGEIFNVGNSTTPCVSSRFKEDSPLPDSYEFMNLRTSFNYICNEQYTMASKGEELLFWDGNTHFCGRCGSTMQRHTEISKRCPNCNWEIFPQLSPAILVLVRRGDEALLVHARNFKRPFFGLVAGFVETGESLEECVRREVREETSLEISNIRYVGSQTWPYPANLMIGFTADYAGGELHFADGELSEGGFFRADNLPMIPTRPSLARQLIDDWLVSYGISTADIP